MRTRFSSLFSHRVVRLSMFTSRLSKQGRKESKDNLGKQTWMRRPYFDCAIPSIHCPSERLESSTSSGLQI